MTTTTPPPPPSSPPSSEAAPSSGPSRRLTRAGAEELGVAIQEQAARVAEATCRLLLMVGDFDARGGSGWYVGLKSTAHWLSWACSMSPGTAREHVRVARALRSMPLTVAEFGAGRLSYSKVREVTRVADRVDEATLVGFARAMTASQLARTISSFRAVDGARLGQDAVRQARWRTREDGMVEIRAVLPAEVGAEVVTALELALDRDGHAPEGIDDAVHAGEIARGSEADHGGEVAGTELEGDVERAARVTATPTLEQRTADALASLARTYLDAEPDDRSGEDRHLVIVQVAAEALTREAPAADVPAGTSGAPACEVEGVPAGTSRHCGIVGQGPVERRTAERLACTGKVAVVITDAGGEVLHLGRSRRLASRAQRRALRLRDRVCSFPGCHQSRHLDAHHTTPWAEGGLTDIEGLALLCRRHHVIVHEGRLRLVLDQNRAPGRPRFQVLDERDRPVTARWPALLEHLRTRVAESAAPAQGTASTGATRVDGTAPDDPDRDTDPERIAATTRGAGFRLADCVDALCRSAVHLAA